MLDFLWIDNTLKTCVLNKFLPIPGLNTLTKFFQETKSKVCEHIRKKQCENCYTVDFKGILFYISKRLTQLLACFLSAVIMTSQVIL